MQTSDWEDLYLEILTKVQKSNQSSAKTEANGALPSWKDMLREPYGAYDIKIRLENGTDICKMHSTFIIGRWLRTQPC